MKTIERGRRWLVGGSALWLAIGFGHPLFVDLRSGDCADRTPRA